MIKQIFVVYDIKSTIYSTPFFAVRREVALRDFQRAVNDPSSDIYHAPQDYDLLALGSYDDETAVFELFPNREFIQNASFLRKFDGE